MKEVGYFFDIKRVASLIKLLRARKVLIQLPEGLKRYAINIVKELEKFLPKGVMVFISGEKAYGACDIAFEEAKMLKADLIIHYGHTPRYYPGEDIPVLYISAFSNLTLSEKLCNKLVKVLNEANIKRVGVTAVIQHSPLHKELRSILRKHGFNAYIGRGYGVPDGIVIGCNYTSAMNINDLVDAHIIIAGGLFHGLGLRIATGKKVYVLDPYRDDIIDIEKEYRRVYALSISHILRASKAKVFGIIVCLKSGQFNIKTALKIKQRIVEHGRKAIILTMRDITWDKLLSFPSIEVFVNTGCPRLALDDRGVMKIPIIAPHELEFILERRDIAGYQMRI